MSSPDDGMWDEVKKFTFSLPELVATEFKPYDYAVSVWKKTQKDSNLEVSSHKETLKRAREHTGKVADAYLSKFQAISQAFVHKSQVTENIERTLAKSKQTIIDTQKRFNADPALLLKSWKKVLKYQKEIDILTQIEDLVQTPTIVFQLVDQGNILEAVNKIQGSMIIFETDQHMREITALQDVRTRLESCKNRVIDIIFENLFQELFIEDRPDNFSFFPSSFSDTAPMVDSSKTREYISALVTLQSTSTFIEQLREQLPLKLAELMTKTADQIKVKKQRAISEAKDIFGEFVEVYQSFNPQNPLINFIDAVLCKIWVLLVQCSVIDESSIFPSEQKDSVTLAPAWKVIIEEIGLITNVFTVSSGNKSVVSRKLTYHFLSADTTPTNATYNNLRIQLGIRPSAYNILHIYPLVKNFRNMAVQVLNLVDLSTSDDEKFAKESEGMIKARSNDLANTPVNPRTIKVDSHNAPVFLNASFFIDNIAHFIRAGKKFVSLQNVMAEAACDVIGKFCSQCATMFDQINEKSRFFSKSLVNIDSYLGQPLVNSILVKGNEDIDADYLSAFYKFEFQNEDILYSGRKVLTIEDTVRERFQLPTIATIAESLIFLRDKIIEFLRKNPFTKSSMAIFNRTLRSVNVLINKCLIFIHVELRCRCYAEIVNALKGSSYKIQSVPQNPDNYATVLTQMYTSTYERLEPCLVSSRLLFAFIGIPNLVYALHIRFLPQVREINEKGAQAILQNLMLFRQTFSNTHFPEMPMFSKAHWFANNIYLAPDRIIHALKGKKQFFTYDEIKPIFQMQQKQNENIADALEELQLLFMEKKEEEEE
ncbi:hypothetical protein TRFO_02910 [Tritrichomonas foetus]|uniref:Exocyst complex component Sec8 n=1 Tax=Tritrichomonas foetus TaxID=1144522 RepID=A0A1J4KWE8_9EUKA|nr:hypothetical protein TRFO_02910 [Tritrichomonas foetus]|eukprot:OHT15563.1 hypothetical protein TRFO_02910 [Tritrichomonas foetus]